MNRKELIKKYIEFFKSKDHKEIPNSSLIPENDPTVLFTTAGMHPLIPFLLGQPHPQGKRLVNVQKCIRTGDIEEVGDTTHHTFFEMLGNWSLGDYFKKESIEYSFEFLTKVLKIPKEKLAVTFFAEEKNKISADFDSKEIWKNLGISENKITPLGKEDNWWGPAEETGPCGPDTEIFYWRSKNQVPKKFNPKYSSLATEGTSLEEQDKGEESHKWVEIWNNVFMEYEKTKQGKYVKTKQKNIDTGMGVERTVAILNGLEDNYEAEMWLPIIKQIEILSHKNYQENKREMRIIADHIKAACFIMDEGIIPSNTEQGYVLRRLIRRAIRFGRIIGIHSFVEKLTKPIFKIYSDYDFDQEKIVKELIKEETKFEKTLEKGLRELKKMAWKEEIHKPIGGKQTFLLFQSYGFPIEITKEIALSEFGKDVDEKEFYEELAKHQKLSQTASKGKFKSGLADNSEATTKLHTASHILLESLKKTLNSEIIQKGSNINPERLRFDFNFDRKLTDEEKENVEKLVNTEIQKNHKVIREEMSPQEAKEKGASGIFNSKYGDIVSVYTIGNFSKEICTGPHVENTDELGKFKITKQESCGSGVRRIKAVLE
jgi:alanyl-tRNA synthetase